MGSTYNKKIILTIGLLLTFVLEGFSQRNRYSEDDYLYDKEFAAGINFHTNGGLIGGVTLKYAQVIRPRMYHSFFLEVANIKDPREQRVFNFTTGSSFTLAKSNYLFAIRPMYGREYVLFKKAREQGIQVNLIGTAGPTFGLVAPYLVRFSPNNTSRIITAPYSPVDNNVSRTRYQGSNYDILGSGNIFESFSDANVVLGGSFKLGMSFEFGVIKSNVTGFETGLVIDAYTREIAILAYENHRSVYSSVYLTFFFGFRK